MGVVGQVLAPHLVRVRVRVRVRVLAPHLLGRRASCEVRGT